MDCRKQTAADPLLCGSSIAVANGLLTREDGGRFSFQPCVPSESRDHRSRLKVIVRTKKVVRSLRLFCLD